MRLDQPYHAGEIAVQERVFERTSAIRNGAAIADSIIVGARKFVSRQPLVVLGSVGHDGRLWVSIVFGEQGFAVAEEKRVAVDLERALIHAVDPLLSNLVIGAPLGMLFIELATRRRLRVNGVVSICSERELKVDVRESYPNCPKYIQRRNLAPFLFASLPNLPPSPTHQGTNLTSAVRKLLEDADTFFVASSHPTRGVDASHRGGPPGFVRMLDERTLRIPDYAGNSMFNTLGNLLVNPNAGLVFLDFASGDLLQLTGCGEPRFDFEDPRNETGGTGRFWDFTIDRWLLSKKAAPREWEFLDYSPVLPGPGTDTGKKAHGTRGLANGGSTIFVYRGG